MSDAMAVLHKLQTGLDVNVKFTGVRVFEYTPECIVFDLLDIPLYHGWLVDPQVKWTVLIPAVSLNTEISHRRERNSRKTLFAPDGQLKGETLVLWTDQFPFW